MTLIKNKRKISFFIFSLIIFLFFTPLFFVKASIISNVINLFSSSSEISQDKINLNTVDFLKPNLSIFAFLKKSPNEKSFIASSTEDLEDKNLEIDNSGALVVKSGSLRLSTEKEKPVNDTISLYEVKSGDSLDTVAKLFGVSKNTIIWANDLKSEKITKGDQLLIFPMSGLQYTVKAEGTIKDIAKKYKADPEEIATYNGVDQNTKLAKGDTIFIPDPEGDIERELTKSNSKPVVKKQKVIKYKSNVIAGYFMYPVSGCKKSQNLHGPYSTAVDIACPIGTAVAASAEGVVIKASGSGYNGGYGEVVIIAHANGTQAIYAHLSRVDVSVGQKVEQGQIIAATGNTGRSTGPHLHFETRGTANPF